MGPPFIFVKMGFPQLRYVPYKLFQWLSPAMCLFALLAPFSTMFVNITCLRRYLWLER